MIQLSLSAATGYCSGSGNNIAGTGIDLTLDTTGRHFDAGTGNISAGSGNKTHPDLEMGAGTGNGQRRTLASSAC